MLAAGTTDTPSVYIANDLTKASLTPLAALLVRSNRSVHTSQSLRRCATAAGSGIDRTSFGMLVDARDGMTAAWVPRITVSAACM
jgi:hypothetical protein